MSIEISAAVFFQSLLLIVLCQFLVYLKLQKVIKSQQIRIKSLSNDLQALLICARGVGEKLHNQEDEFRFIQERQEKIELSEGNNSLPPYKHIMGLINQGTSQNDLMNNCDLTKGEVELMMNLQKKSFQTHSQH